jgi:hypothetical protein
LSNGR